MKVLDSGFCFWSGLLLLCLRAFIKGDSVDRVVHDQRQSGKFNIQVSVKDVAIIEMGHNAFDDQSFDEDDYYYDEEDLTIRPLPAVSSTPSGETTRAALEPESQYNQSIPISATRETPFNSSDLSSSTNLLADHVLTHAGLTTPLFENFRNKMSTTSLMASNNVQDANTNVTPVAMKPLELVDRPNIIAPMEAEALVRANQPMPNRFHTAKLFERPGDKPQMLPRSADEENPRIYKFKIRHVHKQTPGRYRHPTPYHQNSFARQRCRSGKFLDEAGICRLKRSPSILKKLFNMLVSLPLRDHETNEDEATEK